MTRNHRCYRISIAHWFSHGDNVRLDTVAQETPKRFPGAAEAGLHFIRNEQPALRAHRGDGFGDEARRIGEHAVRRKDGVENECRRLDAISLHLRECSADAIGEARADLFCSASLHRTERRIDKIDMRPER